MANSVFRRRTGSACFARLLALSFLLTSLSACEPSDETDGHTETHTEPLNVLLITLDTTRADALGVYGQSLPTTPNIDRLARDGVTFLNAMSAAPITLPSHASMMTGNYPFVHGVRSNGRYVLADQNVTLAEILQGNGYRTAAEIGSIVLNRRTGLDQGFEFYRDLDSPDIERVRPPGSNEANANAGLRERSASDITRRAIEFLQAQRGRPFFLWLHYFAPHAPYIPPADLRGEVGGDAYLGEIHYADLEIGRVLTELKRLALAEDTLIVVTADHGESLGAHSEVRHAFLVYDSTMRVPLIVSGPGGVRRGVQVDAVVRLIDLAPTILDLVGLSPMENVQGVSLAPLVSGMTSDLDLLAYGETSEPNKIFGSSVLRFVRRGNWKYIHKVNPELYDIGKDPAEERNLAVEQPERVVALRAKLSNLIRNAPEAVRTGRAGISRKEADQLRALGYVTVETAELAEGTPESTAVSGPDPNEVVADQSAFELWMDDWLAHASEDSYDGFKQLALRHAESSPFVMAHLGSALKEKRYEDVMEFIERSLERSEERDPLRRQWMKEIAADIDGADNEALRVLQRLAEFDPCNQNVRSKLAEADAAHGKLRGQRDLLKAALEHCGPDWQLLNDLAYFYATCEDEGLRNAARSVELAERAVAMGGGETPAVLDTLAAAYTGVGDFERARDAMRKAVALIQSSNAPDSVREKYRARLVRIEEEGRRAK